MLTDAEANTIRHAGYQADPDQRGISAPALLAIIRATAELLAARGGTMTAEAIAHALKESRGGPSLDEMEQLRQHIAAHGAMVAALGGQVTAVEADRDRYAAEVSTLREKVAALERTANELQRQRDHSNEAWEVATVEVGRLRQTRSVLEEENASPRARCANLEEAVKWCEAQQAGAERERENLSAEIATATAQLDEWRIAPGLLVTRVREARNGPPLDDPRCADSDVVIPIPSELAHELAAKALPVMESQATGYLARAEAAEKKLAELDMPPDRGCHCRLCKIAHERHYGEG